MPACLYYNTEEAKKIREAIDVLIFQLDDRIRKIENGAEYDFLIELRNYFIVRKAEGIGPHQADGISARCKLAARMISLIRDGEIVHISNEDLKPFKGNNVARFFGGSQRFYDIMLKHQSLLDLKLSHH